MTQMPHPPRLRALLLSIPALLCIVLTPSSVFAQDDDVIRVTTELVVLNITVTDKSGQYVPGLKISDFKIFEDGKEVTANLIASFSLHESPFASVVLLDTSGSMETRLSLARSAAIRFLDRLRIEDVDANLPRQSLQLFDGRRSLHVCRNQQHLLPL